MFSRVPRQVRRRCVRISAVAPLVMLLAGTIAARPQQDTAAAARAARVRAAAAKIDTSARIRAKARLPAGSTSDGPAQPTVISMPRLIGLDTLGAIRVLRSKKMLSYAILPPAPGLIARDEIATQDPLPDSPYTYPSPVRLTLAGIEPPQDLVAVPSVVGLTTNEAERALEQSRLGVESVEEPVSSPDSIGRVIRQRPDSGERVPPGSRVSIVWGRDARVAVPHVTGLTLDSARRLLRDAGLVVKPTTQRVDGEGDPVDSVVGQLPESGAMVPAEQLVVLQLGRAPPTAAPTIAVPPLLGLDSAAAIRALADAGLRTYVVQLPDTGVAQDTVDAQIPVAGSLVSPQTPIVLRMRARIDVVHPRFPLIAIVALVLVATVASGFAARTIWPPPTITPSARVEPGVSELADFSGSLVAVSVSFRSHLETEPSTLEIATAPPA